jgi:hypothetical protein
MRWIDASLTLAARSKCGVTRAKGVCKGYALREAGHPGNLAGVAAQRYRIRVIFMAAIRSDSPANLRTNA